MEVRSLLLAFVASTMIAAAPAAAMDFGLNLKKSDSSSVKYTLKDNFKKDEICPSLHYR